MAGAVALLRGINVGGRNLIRMPELQSAFRDAGYADVRTYIQSGNVLFTTDAVAGPALEADVERVLEEPAATPDLLAALPELDPDVDRVASGPGVLYFSRVAARAGSSRLTRIIGMPVYKRLTIRNWNTTARLLALLDGD